MMLTVFTFRFEKYNENTYLVIDETGSCAIVDPGCYDIPEQQQVVQFISKMALRPQMIWNTHCHIDHIFGNQFLAQYYNIPLYLHKKEHPTFKAMPRFGASQGYRITAFDGDVHYLEEGDEVEIGKNTLKILFTPGHSIGSISFYSRQENFIISGDTLFCGRIGKVTLPGGDYNTLVDTIRTRIFVLPDTCVVYPGHGLTTTVGYEKANNLLVCW